MRSWLVEYTPDKENYGETIVRAVSYTMAVVRFMMDYPNCECTNVKEVCPNESKVAEVL